MMDQDVTGMLQDQLRFLEALYEILNSSEEAETVRVAVSALTATEAGRSFLTANPIKL